MHLVFDLGGVLLRWRPVEFLRAALPHRADQAEALAHSVFGLPDGEWARFDRGVIGADDVVAGVAARTDLSQDEMRAVLAAVPTELVPVEPAVELLGRLRQRPEPLFFLSNMPAPEADRLERDHRFFDWFAAGVFSSRVLVSKPDPRIFALAAERFRVPADDLLFFDDLLPNVLAARAAGWQAEVFTDAAACEADLARRGVL